MASLDQLAGGEWFEVKERLHRPEQLVDLLCSEATFAPALRAAALRLEEAVEGGVFEYRRAVVGEVLSRLAEAEFSSEFFGELPGMEAQLSTLVLATAVQRAILNREVRLWVEKDEEESGDDQEPADDVNQIIADVKEILQVDPEARMNGAIKNILLQLAKYREESETYRKLKEQATSYRLEMYSKTFSTTFNQIFESIRRNYAAYLQEQEDARRRAKRSILEGLETQPWTRALTRQLEELSWMRSTVRYAMREHSGVREPLVRLAKRRESVLALITEEEERAADVTGGEAAAARLSRMLSHEVARRLAAWAEER